MISTDLHRYFRLMNYHAPRIKAVNPIVSILFKKGEGGLVELKYNMKWIIYMQASLNI